MTLNEVLKNTNYELSLFSEEGRDFVEGAIGDNYKNLKKRVYRLNMRFSRILEQTTQTE